MISSSLFHYSLYQYKYIVILPDVIFIQLFSATLFETYSPNIFSPVNTSGCLSVDTVMLIYP